MIRHPVWWCSFAAARLPPPVRRITEAYGLNDWIAAATAIRFTCDNVVNTPIQEGFRVLAQTAIFTGHCLLCRLFSAVLFSGNHQAHRTTGSSLLQCSGGCEGRHWAAAVIQRFSWFRQSSNHLRERRAENHAGF